MNEFTNQPSEGFDTIHTSVPEESAPVAPVGSQEPASPTEECPPASEPCPGQEPITWGDRDPEPDDPGRPVSHPREEAPESPVWKDSPFVSREEAHRMGQEEAWEQAFQREPAVRAPKVKTRTTKTGSGTGKLVAAALACTLVGSLLGGIVAGSVSNRKWEKTTAQLQQQIDTLKGGSGSGVVHSVSTPIVYDSADGTLAPAQVYQQNVASVISVTTQGTVYNGWATSQFTSTGSGFIISSDGYILTNYHVIEGYSSVTVTTVDDVTYDAQVVGYDSFSDVALLKVEATELPAVTIGDSDVVNVGDQVAAIGNPLGELASSQTVGYISAKNRMVNTDGTTLNMLQTDAAINSGNSGGPLFNMLGQVIGITTAKYSGSSSSGASIEGIGFAIPINTVMELVADLMEYGYVNQAYLGVGLEEMDASVAAAYGLPSGPRVASLEEDHCAQKAGVQVGDIITGLGEYSVQSYSDLVMALRNFKAGDTTAISIYRAGAELELTITLDEKPADVTAGPQQGSQSQQDAQDQQGSGYGNYPWDFFPFP